MSFLGRATFRSHFPHRRLGLGQSDEAVVSLKHIHGVHCWDSPDSMDLWRLVAGPLVALAFLYIEPTGC